MSSQNKIQAILFAAILIVVNLLGSGYFWRLDLTSEKRYTLSDVTLRTADSLDRIMTVKVYLHGENLPPRVKRFSDAVRTTLLEMKARAGTKLQYQFIDPSDNRQLQEFLVQKGVQPIPLDVQTEAESSRRWIFPGAVITYDGKDEVVNLLKSDCVGDPRRGMQCDYSKAEAEIEYKLVAQMQRMFRGTRRIVGLLTGQKEYKKEEMKEVADELNKFYEVININCRTGKAIANSKRYLPTDLQKKIEGEGVDVLIVAQPDTLFTEREKYEIDQFIMRGGRVLWLMDRVKIDEKDFYTEVGATLAQPRLCNLDDMFFKYGFKINADVVQDDVCGFIDVTFTHENRPVIQPARWIYFPRVPLLSEHPVVKNLDAVLLRYASTIDTTPSQGIEKKVVLLSSPFSRSTSASSMISLQQNVAQPPPRKVYKNKGNKILALSLEGKFNSLFAGRAAPIDTAAAEAPTAKFIPYTPYPNRMLVVADGSVVLTNHSRFGGEGTPLDNKAFVLNCVEYLMGQNALGEIRAKNVKIRGLNRQKVEGQTEIWRALNLGVPIGITILLGLGLYYRRKRKYESPNKDEKK